MGRDNFGYLGRDERIILKEIILKLDIQVLILFRWQTFVNIVMNLEFPDQLSNYQLFKKALCYELAVLGYSHVMITCSVTEIWQVCTTN
jgi:hypothetical protein